MRPRGGIEEARAEARQAFEQLHVAMVEASATFAHEAEVATRVLEAFKTEPSITTLVAAFPIAEERARLNETLENYETGRRNARTALWQVMLAEGCSIGEISRIFGLSRQLVSRQLRDRTAGT